MELISTTPFGRRPVTAALISEMAAADRPAPVSHIDKWALFRELCTARLALGVSDRDLTVLNALLTFHPEQALSDNGDLIVFPSNRALSERAHGMAESTLRRHLAALVEAGLLRRHDSPNGKRYAARDRAGEISRAFGFDLRPLLQKADMIVHAAEAARDAAERLRRLRETISLQRRDAGKLIDYAVENGLAGDWDDLTARLATATRAARRKLDMEDLERLGEETMSILRSVHMLLDESEEMSGNDADSERHLQNSKPDSLESELCQEKAKAAGLVQRADRAPAERIEAVRDGAPALPLALVLKACPDILDYAQDPPRHWHELVALARFVRGMMGISPSAWDEAERIMGAESAAVTVAAMLQRVSEINNPGGYLRALTTKAAAGGFSPAPMVMALLSGGGRRAA